MKKSIIAGVIVLFATIVGILSFLEYKHWQSYWNAEEIWLTKDEAENTLKTFAEQYLKEIGLNYNIEKIVVKPKGTYGEGSYGEVNSTAMNSHPTEKGKKIKAGSYGGKIIFSSDSKQGTLEVHYDASVAYGFTKENIFPSYKSCAIENGECALEIDEPLECENKTGAEKVPENLSKYFNCICKDSRPTKELLNKIKLPASNCEECLKLKEEQQNKSYKYTSCSRYVDGSHDPNQYFCNFDEELNVPSIGKCELDFSATIKPTNDNRIKLEITTANYIPELLIKSGKKCNYVIKDIQTGKGEKIIDCKYEENTCFKLFFDKYLLKEFNCHKILL